jgi:hypothetical protein
MEAIFMTKQQLAENFRICTRTFNKRLVEKGIILKKGLISPKDQELIYSKLGFPPNYNIIKRGSKF